MSNFIDHAELEKIRTSVFKTKYDFSTECDMPMYAGHLQSLWSVSSALFVDSVNSKGQFVICAIHK